MNKLLIIFSVLMISIGVMAQSYAPLDSRARQLPLNQAETKAQLVAQLTKGLTDPESKARVIAAWMVYQIEHNGYEWKKLVQASAQNKLADPPLKNDIFKTRIGTPQEYADLFNELATMAGLQVVTIEGYAGRNVRASNYSKRTMKALEPTINHLQGIDYKLQKYIGAWNAVKIENEWKLIDTYWMQQGEMRTGQDRSDRAMRSLLKKRMRRPPSLSSLTRNKHIDDDYFFAKPQDFAKTHFPNDSKWQLLPVPRTWSSFTN